MNKEEKNAYVASSLHSNSACTLIVHRRAIIICHQVDRYSQQSEGNNLGCFFYIITLMYIYLYPQTMQYNNILPLNNMNL